MRFIVKVKRAYWTVRKVLLRWQLQRLTAQHNRQLARDKRDLPPNLHIDLAQTAVKLYGPGKTLKNLGMRDLEVLKVFLVNTHLQAYPAVPVVEPPVLK